MEKGSGEIDRKKRHTWPGLSLLADSEGVPFADKWFSGLGTKRRKRMAKKGLAIYSTPVANKSILGFSKKKLEELLAA